MRDGPESTGHTAGHGSAYMNGAPHGGAAGPSSTAVGYTCCMIKPRSFRRSLLSLAIAVCFLPAFGQDLEKLDAYIADAVVKFDQPGLAVGIVKDGKLIFQKGYGKLDLAKPDPVTPNSVFYCASLSLSLIHI